MTVYRVDNKTFVKSLASCEGLLCNAGFETPAETLYLGKKLMVIPMKRQYEQQCNAEALRGLGVTVSNEINGGFYEALSDWVNSSFKHKAYYHDNIPQIVERILNY